MVPGGFERGEITLLMILIMDNYIWVQVIGEEFDQFQTFCNICDRLISEFEEISIEKR